MDQGQENGNKMIGYNISHAKLLMKEIKNLYKNFGTTITDSFGTMTKTLDTYWVGEDEQSYCIELAKKVSKLYYNAYDTAEKGIDIIYKLMVSWHDFQTNNLLKSDGTKVQLSSDIQITNISESDKEKITDLKPESETGYVKYTTHTLSIGVRRGIVDGKSATCKKALADFVDEIKKVTTTFKNTIEIKAGRAFFGQYTSKVEEALYNVALLMESIITAVNDMYEAIDQLTTTNYGESVTEAESAMSNVSSSATSSQSNITDKWQGSNATS